MNRSDHGQVLLQTAAVSALHVTYSLLETPEVAVLVCSFNPIQKNQIPWLSV